LPPDSQGGLYQPQVKRSQPQFPKAAARLPRVTSKATRRAFFHCNICSLPTADARLPYCPRDTDRRPDFRNPSKG
jgi:hypothetical protein